MGGSPPLPLPFCYPTFVPHQYIQPSSTEEATSTCFLTIRLSASEIKKRSNNKVKRGSLCRWSLPVVLLKFSPAAAAGIGLSNHHPTQIPGDGEAFKIMVLTPGVPMRMWETAELSHRMTKIFSIILNILVIFINIWKIFNCNYKLHFEKVHLYSAGD